MASSARIDELKKKFDENPRRYFAPLANEFRKMGEIEQAIMICEEFLPQQAGHMSGHIVYGQALYEAGRLAEARTVFETALTLDPENLIALRHLGDIAKGNGELETARHWYTRVLDADPRNEEIQALLYSLDDTPAIVIDETRMGTPAPPGSARPPLSREEQRFAPPPTALPQLPKSDAPAAPPPPPPASVGLEIEKSLSVEMPSGSAHAAASDIRPAEGLESTEFVPPPSAAAGGPPALDNFEAGEFTAPTGSIAPLPGLEETSVGAADVRRGAETTARTALDVDDGSTLAPQGDPIAPGAAAAVPPAAPAREEFSIPDASAGQRKTPVGRQSAHTDWRGFPSLDESGEPTAEQPSPDIPTELPPAVIAAEAELVYLVPPDEVPTESEDAPAAPAAFVTETMAELFVKQGFREQALEVYRQLLAASPQDDRLRAKVAELQPPPAAPEGPTVREFFARLAVRRPGERSAAAAPPSADDFASFEAVPERPTPMHAPSTPSHQGNTPGSSPPRSAAPSGSSTPMSSAVERAATTQSRPGGTIDALFGNRAVGTSEDSAASALAQAFGGREDSPSISGRPARAAAKELSLDSVFRDGGARAPRPSGSFSFDQFFSEGASGAAADKPANPTTGGNDVVAPAEPAERTADDISQFNSWLQGLKQR
jgi:tetratricopeptide (TPR) repeat protein